MSERVPNVNDRTLNGLLEHFGFEAREEGVKHDALTDCILTANVYMEIVKLPEVKTASLGFAKDNE